MSILDLEGAKLSLREAERLEGEGTRSEVRQELLLGILQSNIAIAEALTSDKCEPDEWPDECGDCECSEPCDLHNRLGPLSAAARQIFKKELEQIARSIEHWGRGRVIEDECTYPHCLASEGCEGCPGYSEEGEAYWGVEDDLCDEDCPFCADEEDDRTKGDLFAAAAREAADFRLVNAPLLADPAVRVLINFGTAG